MIWNGAIIHSHANTSWRTYNKLILYHVVLRMQNAYVTHTECMSVSLYHVFICGWATGDMRLSLTCDRNNHRSPHPWLSHPRGIIQTYNVTLSLVISRELSHIWRLLPDVRGKSHGSNWEGFDRAVVVASESRANESFEPIPRNDSVEPIRSVYTSVFGRNKIVYDIKNHSC